MAPGWLARLIGDGDSGRNVAELARQLGMPPDRVQAIRVSYTEFSIPKRSGGTRKIAVPNADLKAHQRTILRRLLTRLRAHPAAHGFERQRSIVTHAHPHVGRAVVVRMDIRDFFGTTRAKRVTAYFRKIGWNREAADLLTQWCTWKGALPQGAPTSPRLSNLLNYKLDVRLARAAERLGASYTRYADDITFSFNDANQSKGIIHLAKQIVADEGYTLHERKKLHVRRRHQRQIVTGLVVNEKVALPRDVRRRLRAVEHHLANGQPATLTEAQLAGWKSFSRMVQGA